MSETVTGSVPAKTASKKQVKKELLKKIAAALDEYKSSFSKKEFSGKLKKASKLFAVDIAKTARKKLLPAGEKKVVKSK